MTSSAVLDLGGEVQKSIPSFPIFPETILDMTYWKQHTKVRLGKMCNRVWENLGN